MTVSLYVTIGKTVHKLDGLWSSITWSGDTKIAYRTLEFTLINTKTGKTRIIKPELGGLVRLKDGKKELFRGYLFKTDISTDGTQTFVAYDPNVYLTKSSDAITFKKKTATQIIQQLAEKFGIPVGELADTGVVLPRLILRDKSPYDMAITALTESTKKGAGKYLLGNSEGKVTLTKVTTEVLDTQLSTETNITSVSFSESIEDRKTQVKLTGGDESAVNIKAVEKSDDIAKYGIMQHYEHNSDVKKESELRTLAKALLKELNTSKQEFSVEVLGKSTYTAGKRIEVNEPMSSRKGNFYISTDSHSFNADGTYITSLTLSRKVELSVEEYVEPTEKTTSWVTPSGKYKAIAYETGWKATAYAYQLGGINGSTAGITASGTKVKAGRTIAVDPSVIPLGSVVAVYIPSAKQYSGIYLAEDTGGAIKGKRIDIAHDPKGVYDFGVKNVQVSILKRGTGRADARSKVSNWDKERSKAESKLKKVTDITPVSGSKSAQVVALARSLKGKLTYQFGGKNIPSGRGDCSGFTQYVYTKLGISMPHGTASQVNVGKAVNKSDAQPGDVVFFQGTYRGGVSHVGIVTTPGKCVSLNDNGCTEHSYISGYWGSHFMTIRRVL